MADPPDPTEAADPSPGGTAAPATTPDAELPGPDPETTPPPPDTGHGSPPPEAGHQSPAPNAGRESPAPEAGDDPPGPPAGASRPAPADDGPPAPGRGDRPSGLHQADSPSGPHQADSPSSPGRGDSPPGPHPADGPPAPGQADSPTAPAGGSPAPPQADRGLFGPQAGNDTAGSGPPGAEGTAAGFPPRGRWVLRRSVRDRKLKGVAGGVAAAADLDPTLVRLLFAVAAFSGWGIAAYIVLAVVLQDETVEDPARPLHPDQRRPLRIGLGVAAALAVLRFVGDPFVLDGDLGLPLVLIAVGAAVLWARRDQSPTPAPAPVGRPETWVDPTPPTAPPWPSATTAAPAGAGIAWRSTGHDLLRLAAAFLAVGALLALLGGAFLVVVGAVPMRLPLLPAAVAIAGILALVVAVVRRARIAGLLVSGGVLVAAAALAVGLASFPGGPTGTRFVVVGPETPLLERYEHSAGRLVLDLGRLSLEPGSRRRVVAEVGTGQLTVMVPAAATTDVRARLGLGGANLFGREQGGPGVDVTGHYGGGEGAGRLDLDLHVGLGEIRVELAPEPTFGVTCAVPGEAKGDGTDPVTCPHPARLAGSAMTCSVNLIGPSGGTGDGRAFCRRPGSPVPAIGRFATSCAVSAEGEALCEPLAPRKLAELEAVRRGPAPPTAPGSPGPAAAPAPPGTPVTPAGPEAPAPPRAPTAAGGVPLLCGPADAAGERTCTAAPAAATTTTAPRFRCREEPSTPGQLSCVPA